MITLEKDFHVEVEQNGKLIEVINGEVTLEKEEFNLVFTLPEPMGLLLNSSFNKKTYKLASAGRMLKNRSTLFFYPIKWQKIKQMK